VAFTLASQGLLPSVERLAALGLITRDGERFPCEGCACGCVSARHCWTSCCCHSLDERLAWAEANGIAIPREIALVAYRHLESKAREANLPACCRHEGAQPHACCAHDAPRAPGPVVSALACKGIAGWLVPVLPAPATRMHEPVIPVATPLVAFLIPSGDRAPDALALERTPPPPRA
jgi:hypothetical protein